MSSYWDTRKAHDISEKNIKGSLEKLKEIYTEQNRHIQNEITNIYINLLESGGISSTKLYEYNRLKNMMKEINNILKKYGVKEESVVHSVLEDTFNDTIKNAGGYDAINFTLSREDILKQVIYTKFKGKNFSSRIWNNREKLAKKIEKGIQNVVARGINKDKAVSEIMESCKSSFSNADRLVRTEIMRVMNDGQKEIYKAEGRTHGYYIYAQDSRVCDFCKSISLTSKQTPIPLDEMEGVHHPNCRCTILPKVSLKRKEENKELKLDTKRGIIKQRIADVECGTPMNFEKANSGQVNPNYGAEDGYSINCQSCVPTFEARIRGYNVQTKPNTKGSMCEELSYKTNLAWIDPLTEKPPNYIFDKSRTTPKKYLEFIKDVIKKDERYSIEFSWKGRKLSGHIVNIDLNSMGLLRIKDNQRGLHQTSEWIGDKEVLSYLSDLKYKGTMHGMKYTCVPKLLRIDNIDFNFNVVNEIMEKGELKNER